MMAGTHLCLDLMTCRCVLIETADQCPLSWYYRFGRKNEKVRVCGKCNNCNAIKVCVVSLHKDGGDGPLDKMSMPSSRMRKCLSRNV